MNFPDFQLPTITETVSNVVCIEGEWRIVDTIRAMGVTFDMDDGAEDDDEFKPVPKETREYWFLTDPTEMIFFQYPVQKEHQLLEEPVTDRQFARMGMFKPAFFSMGIESVSPSGYYVDSDDGSAIFQLGLSSASDANLCYDFSRSLHDPARNIYDGNDLNNFVTMEQTNERVKFTAQMPWIGKYKLNIKGTVNVDGKKTEKTLMSYFISCSKPCFYAHPSPFPGATLGTTPDTADLGLEPVNHEPGLIEVEEGRIQFTYHMLKQGFSFRHTLEGEEGDKADDDSESLGNKCVRHYIVDENVVFIIKVRNRGSYLLTLWASLAGREPVMFATYHLDVQMGCPDFSGMDFPDDVTPDNCGLIGDLFSGRDPLVRSVSHTTPIIDCPPSGDMKIAMQPMRDDITSVDHLLKIHDVDTIEDVSFYVLQYTKPDNTIKYYITFPKAGIYTLELFDKDPSDNDANCVYQYIINVTQPKEKCFPIPKFCYWEDGMKIFEPITGYLQVDKTYRAKFRVPRATSVNIAGETELKRGKEENWQGEFYSGNSSHQFYVYATFAGSAGARELFQYTVSLI